ncbi:sensor histidine kinase [Tropicimonas isoalkanivorans]|uniref:histidine kinase n=1 Tax=Tropicimonas isoalkanivorans TaxID=441112 RepID=A0A1I1R4A6_9RHOB|nr:sensor histidine kinase [Tropicimonas isoalkanivorans]SFD29037.1 Two-component sensor histidine kinase, contains HisKA and HATPase domains [Tropicimonas isoalkanivorans]
MKPPVPHRGRRLGVRVACVLALATLPLALLATVNAATYMAEQRSLSENALLKEIVGATASEKMMLREASGVVGTLAVAARAVLDDAEGCSKLLNATLLARPYLSFAALVPQSGQIRCSTAETEIDIAQDSMFADLISYQEPQNRLVAPSPSGAAPTLALTAPVVDAAGAYSGLVAIYVPLAELLPQRDTDQLALFSAAGEIFGGGDGGTHTFDVLPETNALIGMTERAPTSYTATDEKGIQRIYAVAPLVAGELYAIGLRQGAAMGLWGWVSPVTTPAIVWLSTLALAFLALDRFFIRKVGHLAGTVRGLAEDPRAARDIGLDLNDSTWEFREIGSALQILQQALRDNEAELQEAEHQRDVLLREVHHRVRNNLQLIASIMNMQIRRVESGSLRDILVRIQARILNLAAIHRELLQTPGIATVHADELFGKVIPAFQLRLKDQGHGHEISTQLDPVRMSPEQAVPLALLAAEALNDGSQYAAEDEDGVRRIDFTFVHVGEELARLEVSYLLSDRLPGAATMGTGGGSPLIRSFASQLGCQLDEERTDGRYRLRIDVPLVEVGEAPMADDIAPVQVDPT